MEKWEHIEGDKSLREKKERWEKVEEYMQRSTETGSFAGYMIFSREIYGVVTE